MNDRIKTCIEIVEAAYKKAFESNGKFKYVYESVITVIDSCCAILNKDEENEFMAMINSSVIPMACPVNGEFYAYKACFMMASKNICIVKLRIPNDAKRSSGFNNKCRCDKAEVIDIYNPITRKHLKKARSMHPHYVNPFYFDDILPGRLEFIYEVGKIVKPTEPFDNDRWNTCSTGIHFFMTEKEALSYASERI